MAIITATAIAMVTATLITATLITGTASFEEMAELVTYLQPVTP